MNSPNELGIVHAPLTIGVSGRFVFTVHQSDGCGGVVAGTARTVAEFPNLITNTGLDMIGNALDPNACVVGSGATAPAFTDTTLVTQVASTTTVNASTASYSASPEYGQRSQTYRFAAGVAAGNLTEVGMKNGSALWSRALILDGLGSPTTITVLATEVLDVTYVLRVQPPAADVTGNVVISGTTYNYTARPSQTGTWQNIFGFTSIFVPSITAYDGAIGARATQPSGNLAGGSAVANAYSNGSYIRTYTGTFGLNSANYANGVTAFSMSSIGYWQFGINASANIPKNSAQTLTTTFTVAWARV